MGWASSSGAEVHTGAALGLAELGSELSVRTCGFLQFCNSPGGEGWCPLLLFLRSVPPQHRGRAGALESKAGPVTEHFKGAGQLCFLFHIGKMTDGSSQQL